jgi:cephalosporin-C deacetylase-like acetyl esterase
MIEFTDKTGRLGPSTWEASDYPDGEDDYPVSGISWYEAAAYAEFAGKELPTADHWDSAAGFYWSSVFDYIGSRIYPMSNFNRKGPELVGKNHGMTVFGAFDMAGNVREWNRNETEIGRIISGAGFDDSNYLFTTWSQLPPFDRSPQNGFRCAKYLDRDKVPESAFRKINLGEGRDFSKEVPVSEEIFKIYKNQFLYDKLPLKPVIKERDESAEDWIVEKIEFDAAYDGERMLAYLCLPKNANPPYSAVIFFPGIYAFTEKEFNYRTYTSSMFDFILKSGRAVMFPIYSGTYERKAGQPPMRLSHQYSEWLTRSVKDFSRAIDYLDTRTDIDKTNHAFIGHSMGGRLGGIIPAVEDRLSANIIIVGGFSGKAFPEAEEINYVSRVKIPTLMLNGRFDNQFPYETAVLPFFNLLGTPEKDKKIIIYETDHYVPRSEMIRETLNWLDKYLRPVNHLSEK